MSSVPHHEELSEMEESQITTMTLLASEGPHSDGIDSTELKLNELQRALSISPSQSIDYVEMSGTTGKKMGKAERNLLERSATSLSNNSSIGATPKRAKYNPYNYDTSTGLQADSDISQMNETTSTAANLNPAHRESTKSSGSGVQNRLSIASDDSVGAGNSSIAVESNGEQDGVTHTPAVGDDSTNQ